MLDLAQQMEVNCKVNQLIKKANDALNLKLTQPHITYTLKNVKADVVAKTVGHTINFNPGLVNLTEDAIIPEVAHVINFELNNEERQVSDTYKNIVKLLQGKVDIIRQIKPTQEQKRTVKTAKPAKQVKAKKPVKRKGKVGEKKAKAIKVFTDATSKNPKITRQEVITLLVEAFGFINDKPGRIKAAGLYQQAKKAVE